MYSFSVYLFILIFHLFWLSTWFCMIHSSFGGHTRWIGIHACDRLHIWQVSANRTMIHTYANAHIPQQIFILSFYSKWWHLETICAHIFVQINSVWIRNVAYSLLTISKIHLVSDSIKNLVHSTSIVMCARVKIFSIFSHWK